MSFKTIVLIIIVSILVGFAASYVTGILKIYDVSTGTPDCMNCLINESFDSYYGLPLQYRTVGYLAVEKVNYIYFIVDAFAWSVLVFILIYIPMLVIRRNKSLK